MSELEVEREEEVQNTTVTQKERINFLIKEVADLRQTIEAHKGILQSWNCRSRNLSMNVWAGNIKHSQLRGTENQLRTTASEAMKLLLESEEEVGNLELQRLQEQPAKWNNFQTRRVHYTTKFLHAQAEYSTENLMKNIEEYRNKSNAANNELSILKEELADMEKRLGVNIIRVDLEDRDMRNMKKILNAITEIGDNQLHKMKLTHDEMQGKENELKQKKITLEELNKRNSKFVNEPIN